MTISYTLIKSTFIDKNQLLYVSLPLFIKLRCHQFFIPLYYYTLILFIRKPNTFQKPADRRNRQYYIEFYIYKVCDFIKI